MRNAIVAAVVAALVAAPVGGAASRFLITNAKQQISPHALRELHAGGKQGARPTG